MRVTHPAAGCGLTTSTEAFMSINTRLLVGRLRDRPRQAMEAEDIPVGTLVRTPTGRQARVEGYRGYRRDHIVRLVCRYLDPEKANHFGKADVVLLPPELVVVIVEGGC